MVQGTMGQSPVPPAEEAVPTDAELLAAWHARGDRAALEQIIRRHGGMVLAACRRLLGDGPEADDAFQAVFLLLVRKASTLKHPARVAGWLHRVALRVARRARADRARRLGREVSMVEPAAPEPREDTQELRRVIDDELARLPDRYRLPLILCELEGLTLADAAELLGWPKGSVAGRLSRGRELLKNRLARRHRGLLLPLFLPLPALLPAPLVAAVLDAARHVQPPAPPVALAAWRKGGLGVALVLAAVAAAFTATAWGSGGVSPSAHRGARADGAAGPAAVKKHRCHKHAAAPPVRTER